MNGLYLIDNQLIVSGEKTAIVLPRKMNLRGVYGLVTKENKAVHVAGLIVMGQAVTLDEKTFDEHYEKHRIKEYDRIRWWTNKKQLFMYPVHTFVPFDKPVPCAIPPGVNLRVDIDQHVPLRIVSANKISDTLTEYHYGYVGA